MKIVTNTSIRSVVPLLLLHDIILAHFACFNLSVLQGFVWPPG